MDKKEDDHFKILWFVLLFVGLFSAVFIDYLEDGCISDMGGSSVCGSDALHETVMILTIFGLGVVVSIYGFIKEHQKSKKESDL